MNHDLPGAGVKPGSTEREKGHNEAPVTGIYAQISERERLVRERYRRYSENVVRFPFLKTRPPGQVPFTAFGPDAASGKNIIAFRRAE